MADCKDWNKGTCLFAILCIQFEPLNGCSGKEVSATAIPKNDTPQTQVLQALPLLRRDHRGLGV